MDIIESLSNELGAKKDHVANVVSLLDDGNTIPFISRYRKEMTGAMDDQLIRALFDRLNYLRNLEKRKEEIISSIESQEKMTDELMESIQNAKVLSELEDIYRPYKQKRRTRATIARERGLEPLADIILEQSEFNVTPLEVSASFVDAEKEVLDAEMALAGAMDILAEIISDDAEIRKVLKNFLYKNAVISSKVRDGIDDETSPYSMYFNFSEPVSKIQNHRVLAINRGEKDDALRIKVEADDSAAHSLISKRYLKDNGSTMGKVVREVIEDSYSRLIFPSIEREIRTMLTETAFEKSIKVFGDNLRQLLMQPSIKGKVCLALDPAYRTGCKIAVCDAMGKLLKTTVVYPTPPQSKVAEAKRDLTSLIKEFNVEIIAIGNGTASKESEIFIAELIQEIGNDSLAYMMVNEAGASVYSASKLASQEFPDYDVSLRSAVSIARRLQDPLSELVKIDPKSIGVGQYQHDMPQARLSETLTGVVEDCVNKVGVDVNTASPSLLTYIAGLNSTVAKNIVAFREEYGSFKDRKTLLKVPKLGPKAYQQCAGFMRVLNGNNILDSTAVHPESYSAALSLLDLCEYTDIDVKNNNISDLRSRVDAIEKGVLSEKIGVGSDTLHDIVEELLKPGRDIRDDLPAPMLRKDVLDLNDLRPGMELVGTVRNVIDFGAFVDIAVHQDGLVHISQICDKYIRHPSEVLKVGDIVTVWVIDVDKKRSRISLTMKKPVQQ